MTAGPGARVAAMLELLREAADEIVVALDDRARDEDARVLARVADLVVPYPYAEPVDRPLPWLFRLCSGDWVLNLDDDEIPSRALIDALPSIVAAEDVTHYWLRRRWLYPDGSSWIDDHPWSGDYQLRLVRHDPLLVRFPNETHRPIEMLGPGRYVDRPLYHADCLLKTTAERLAKAQRYERLRPGKRIAGGPLNHVFHLPERRDDLRTAAVPDEDVPLIERMLAAAEVRQDAGGRIALPTARDEIDRFWSGRLPRETDYEARLEPLEPLEQLHTGEQRAIAVRVENLGGETWPWGGEEPEIRLAGRWLAPDDDVVVAEGPWTQFPAELRPGEADVVPLHVVAPMEPGRYRLLLDLVHRHVRWFACGTVLDVDVHPAHRLLVAGDRESVERALDELPEVRPEFEPVVVERPEGIAPHYGPHRVSDLHPYLFAGAPSLRLLWTPVLLGRTARLLRASRRLRRGGPVSAQPRGAQQLLEELVRAQVLLVVGTADRETWTLWERTTLVAAARMAGVEVELGERALPEAGGALDRVLLRTVRRLAR
jgi:hypothetical protein